MENKESLYVEKIKAMEELIEFYERKLSVGEIHSSYEYKLKLADISAQIEKSHPSELKEMDEKKAEEILKQNLCDFDWFKYNYKPTFDHVIKAMIEYASLFQSKQEQAKTVSDCPYAEKCSFLHPE